MLDGSTVVHRSKKVNCEGAGDAVCRESTCNPRIRIALRPLKYSIYGEPKAISCTVQPDAPFSRRSVGRQMIWMSDEITTANMTRAAHTSHCSWIRFAYPSRPRTGDTRCAKARVPALRQSVRYPIRTQADSPLRADHDARSTTAP